MDPTLMLTETTMTFTGSFRIVFMTFRVKTEIISELPLDDYIQLIMTYADKVDSVETYADGIKTGLNTEQYTFYSLDDNTVITDGDFHSSGVITTTVNGDDSADTDDIFGSTVTIGNYRNTIPRCGTVFSGRASVF